MIRQADIETLLMRRRPLILAPHPDDESLGCGGLIAAACAAGIAPVVVILTDGAASHPDSRLFPPLKLAALRELEAAQATRILGLPRQHLHFFYQPDGGLAGRGDAFEAIVRRAGTLGEKYGCGMVIGPWGEDPHCDHQAGAGIATAVAQQHGWRKLSYPVWGWLGDGNTAFGEQADGWRLNISAQLTLKSDAIAAHASQHGDVIPDSPRGFRLPKKLLDICTRDFEIFLEQP
jgi:LmbE family N-acetylglucosaminyl deacetylase